MNQLLEILEHKRREICQELKRIPENEMRARALATPKPPDFLETFRSVPMGLIAEVKYASPSAGILRCPFDPARIAIDYQEAGAQAISVLMDKKYFGGSEKQFKTIRNAVSLPLLYKEFVINPWQVWHARALGASLILLIVSALDKTLLDELLACCSEAGLKVLLEVHNEAEMELAKELNAPIIGINNRNLRNFKTEISTTFRLKKLAPAESTLISESGIRSAEDIKNLYDAQIHGALIGEHLLRQKDLKKAVKELMKGINK